MAPNVYFHGNAHTSEVQALRTFANLLVAAGFDVVVSRSLPPAKNWPTGGEADFIVVGDYQVYLLEHKKMGGDYVLAGATAWPRNKPNEKRANPFPQAEKARDLLLALLRWQSGVQQLVVTPWPVKWIDGDNNASLVGAGYPHCTDEWLVRRLLALEGNRERDGYGRAQPDERRGVVEKLASLEYAPHKVGPYVVRGDPEDSRTLRAETGGTPYLLRMCNPDDVEANSYYRALIERDFATSAHHGLFDERSGDIAYPMKAEQSLSTITGPHVKGMFLALHRAHQALGHEAHGNISERAFFFGPHGQVKLAAQQFANAREGTVAARAYVPFIPPERSIRPPGEANLFPSQKGDVYATARVVHEALGTAIGDSTRAVINACLEGDPSKRPSAFEAALRLHIPDGVELVAPSMPGGDLVAFYQGLQGSSPALARVQHYYRPPVLDHLLAEIRDAAVRGEFTVISPEGQPESGRSALMDAAAASLASDDGLVVLRVAGGSWDSVARIVERFQRRVVAFVHGMFKWNLPHDEARIPGLVIVAEDPLRDMGNPARVTVPPMSQEECARLAEEMGNAGVKPSQPAAAFKTIGAARQSLAGNAALVEAQRGCDFSGAATAQANLVAAATLLGLVVPRQMAPLIPDCAVFGPDATANAVSAKTKALARQWLAAHHIDAAQATNLVRDASTDGVDGAQRMVFVAARDIAVRGSLP